MSFEASKHPTPFGGAAPALAEPPRELFALLADFVPQLVWIADPTGYVTWYNQRWHEYTGLTFDESKGRRWQKIVEPAALKEMIPRWEHCIRTGEGFEMVAPFADARGEYSPFLVRGVAMRDNSGAITHWFGTCTDVAEQHSSEDRLRRRNERLHLLSKAAAHVLTAEDQDHVVRTLFDQVSEHLNLDVYFNFMLNREGDALALDSSCGITDEQRAGLQRLEFGQAVCGCVAQKREAMVVTEVQQSLDPRTELIRSLGIRAYACNPLMVGDRLIGTLSFASRSHDRFNDDDLEFLRTICHYVAIAKERMRVEQELREALDRSEAASIAKSEFLANMSHEIRTPMNAVVGLANLMQTDDLPLAKQREFLRTLQLSSQHLLQLINDLLDISKLETQQVELEQTPFFMNDVVNDVVNIQEMHAKEKSIALVVQHADENGDGFVGDPSRIRQVLMNLVGNAIKFTSQGNVIISVTYGASAVAGMATAYIDITDTGIGIAPEHTATIFNKFTQADSSITRKFGGTGLGLSICKTLVELMDGTISVTSAPGKGSCFSLVLPLSLQGHASSKPVVERVPSTEAAPKSKVQILLVEDYWANVLVATAILDNLGYQYEIAENGHEAVKKYTAGHFNAVLMDVQMPEMDGIAATQAIREWEKNEGGGRHTPIIGMTAHALKGDRERCLTAGMDDYLSKPFQPSDLEKKLRTYCKQQTQTV